VQNKTLPAGNYSVTRIGPSYDVMAIRDEEGHTVAMFLTESAMLRKEPDKTELIFERIGDEYFLSKIFEEGNNLGVELPKPRAERDLERETATASIQSVEVPAQLAVNSKR